MHEVVGRVFTVRSTSVVIEEQGFLGADVSHCREDQPAHPAGAELQSPYVFATLSVLLGVVYPGDEDGDVGELARCDVQALGRARVAD